ncbi:MAG: hypothetical protein JWM11_2785 [Planctomycetaceae bacterium]|nr:hypothetical protein [Planctomycetaceae bacterium]
MRHRFSIAAGLCICLLTGFLLQAQDAERNEPVELKSLKNSYQKQRVDALKTVTTWYETQLETLQKKYTQKGNLELALAMQKELKLFRESSLEENEGQIKKSLLASSWSWSERRTDKGVQMTFKDDPSVSHIGMRGSWKLTGNREVTITESTGEKRVLRFDQNLTEYQQVGGKINGRRWK